MSKDSKPKASEMFIDPTKPMTYGWLEQVMAKKNEPPKAKNKKQKAKNNKNPQPRNGYYR